MKLKELAKGVLREKGNQDSHRRSKKGAGSRVTAKISTQ
jgi:hypothetical protein